jgi:hypothetical protein
LIRFLLKPSSLQSEHYDFVASAIRERLGGKQDNLYDGHSLLRAAATMPDQIRSTEPAFLWRDLAQSKLKPQWFGEQSNT